MESVPSAQIAWRYCAITPFVIPACQDTQGGGIRSLESIPGLLKCLQIQACLFCLSVCQQVQFPPLPPCACLLGDFWSPRNTKAPSVRQDPLKRTTVKTSDKMWNITMFAKSAKWLSRQRASLLRQYSGFESRHPSKIINGRHKQRSGRHTLARQKKIYIQQCLQCKILYLPIDSALYRDLKPNS